MNTTTRYFVVGFLLINALILSGCGSDAGSKDKSHATGDIPLALVWNTSAGADRAISRRAPELVFDEQKNRIDCDASGISTIYVIVYDQAGGGFVKDNGDGWNCSDHSGVVKNGPRGTSLTY